MLLWSESPGARGGRAPSRPPPLVSPLVGGNVCLPSCLELMHNLHRLMQENAVGKLVIPCQVSNAFTVYQMHQDWFTE